MPTTNELNELKRDLIAHIDRLNVAAYRYPELYDWRVWASSWVLTGADDATRQIVPLLDLADAGKTNGLALICADATQAVRQLKYYEQEGDACQFKAAKSRLGISKCTFKDWL